MEVEVNAAARKLIVKRTSTTGETRFNNMFSLPSISSPFNCDDKEMELHVFVDRSSVEIMNATGTMCLTNLVFPRESYNRISGVEDVSYRKLSSIW